MSKEQKGFIVYGDNEPLFDRLTDEEAGQLLKAMVKYFNNGNEPEFDSLLTDVVWIQIKLQMDRNAEKYKKKCEKNQKSIQSYWDKVKQNTNEYERIQTYTNATNKDTDKDTDKDTNTNTNTDTNTKSRGGGVSVDDDAFNLWKNLDATGIDAIYAEYPESGGYLIEEVAADVRQKKKRVRNPVSYVLGYAKKVGWDDSADHFDGGGML